MKDVLLSNGVAVCLPRYFTQVLRCAFSNPSVLTEITKIHHMMVPPSQFFSGFILSRVLAHAMQDALRKSTAAMQPSASSSAARKSGGAPKVVS
jgi:hypothetical protein